MPDHDDRPEPPATEPQIEVADAVEVGVDWHTYKLRRFLVSVAIIVGKYCRVQELGDGFIAVEVEGLDPLCTEEPLGVCLTLAEQSARAGKMLRRFVALDGVEEYR